MRFGLLFHLLSSEGQRRHGGNLTTTCAYCGKFITEEEMKNETFVWIREFKVGRKKSEMKFIESGLSIILHRRCFVPSHVDEHPCKQGLVE